MGIEPISSAWKADYLPLIHIRFDSDSCFLLWGSCPLSCFARQGLQGRSRSAKRPWDSRECGKSHTTRAEQGLRRAYALRGASAPLLHRKRCNFCIAKQCKKGWLVTCAEQGPRTHSIVMMLHVTQPQSTPCWVDRRITGIEPVFPE
jgi:hypothetical protein